MNIRKEHLKVQLRAKRCLKRKKNRNLYFKNFFQKLIASRAKNVNSSPARGSKDASANAGGEPKVAKAQQPKPQHNKASSTEL